ncbi:MAG: hypothetical protein GC185_00650 [Alphaproteobacteria bacterium]|nr:hypothetical protein [Alphaproteobacteria bacterium]
MIEVEIFVPASRSIVWECLTDNRHIGKWWGHGVALQAVEQGSFYEPWTDSQGHERRTRGTITAIENKQRLQLEWQDEGWPAPTRVEFMLMEAEGGTKIYIQHCGWEMFPDAERQLQVDHHRAGWKNIMGSFKNYCMTIR